MANLRVIKDRINSIKNTQKITKAMKMVAAAKVKKAENAVKASRPFTLELFKMFNWAYRLVCNEECENIQTNNFIENYPKLLQKRNVDSVGIVVLSSNKGLAGAYSANIVRYTLNMIEKYNQEGKKIKVYFVGQKAVPAIKNAQAKYGFEIGPTYTNVLDGINHIGANFVANAIAKDYIEDVIDEIHLVTTRYKNMMTYHVEDWQLLPVVSQDKAIREFRDKKLDEELNIKHDEHYIEPLSEFMPNIDAILSKIVPMYVSNIVYQALLEAQASELASRMTAMSSATNNAQEMISTLTIEYNKERQAKITQEITEVISGAGALK